MSVNKFGASARTTADIRRETSLRAFVRDTALCSDSSDYNAKNRRIRHLATPEDDNDAASKCYVERVVGAIEIDVKRVGDEIKELKKEFNNIVAKIEIRCNEIAITIENFKESLKSEKSNIIILKSALTRVLNSWDNEKIRHRVRDILEGK